MDHQGRESEMELSDIIHLVKKPRKRGFHEGGSEQYQLSARFK